MIRTGHSPPLPRDRSDSCCDRGGTAQCDYLVATGYDTTVGQLLR